MPENTSFGWSITFLLVSGFFSPFLVEIPISSMGTGQHGEHNRIEMVVMGT